MKCFRSAFSKIVFSLVVYLFLGNVLYGAAKENVTTTKNVTKWQESILNVPYDQRPSGLLQLIRQDYASFELDKSCMRTPFVIGGQMFTHGLGTHSASRIKIQSPEPIERFFSWVGVNNVNNTQGSVVFIVSTDEDGELYNSGILNAGQDAKAADVDLNDRYVIYLDVNDAGDGPNQDYANWADALIFLKNGVTLKVSDLPQEIKTAYYPFHFIYNNQKSDELLRNWKHTKTFKEIDDTRTEIEHKWVDPDTDLTVTWKVLSYSDYSAIDWLLYFENNGNANTAIIQDVQAMNLVFMEPMAGAIPYRLHSINGGVVDPTYYEPRTTALENKKSVVLGARSGRPSTNNTPFFKLETGKSSFVGALEWPGNWEATFKCENSALTAQAGMENTHFLLHPGENVRSPRILLMQWEGDTIESNAQFRQLIYKHYVPKKDGAPRLPTPFCNTCFTRGGGWLNETTAENQISLIKVYSKLGLEAIMTDAGWFEQGWPNGAGNYTPRKDNYPDGMAPVAAAANENGIIYGLWFEPERVVNGTDFHKEHPEWVLGTGDPNQGTFLANFGLPQVQEHFFNIVKGYMELPGFRVYRQDFNMDPLPYWKYNDAPDRQGITEMKYAHGLYAYWDRIRSTWPDVLMEECASGGHRITLGTVKRFDFHQNSDYWWDNEACQSSLWSVSQYLPNNTIVSHLSMYNSPNLDDYSFHSNLASSLCFAWIADAPGFDNKRAKELIGRYKEVRHLLVGAWYPLLPYNYYYHDFTPYEQDPLSWAAGTPAKRENMSYPRDGWVGSQYHRPDLDEGMLLVFRHPKSPFPTAEVDLRAIDSKATYKVTSERNRTNRKIKGSDLAKGFLVTLEVPKSSDLILYKKISK